MYNCGFYSNGEFSGLTGDFRTTLWNACDSSTGAQVGVFEYDSWTGKSWWVDQRFTMVIGGR